MVIESVADFRGFRSEEGRSGEQNVLRDIDAWIGKFISCKGSAYIRDVLNIIVLLPEDTTLVHTFVVVVLIWHFQAPRTFPMIKAVQGVINALKEDFKDLSIPLVSHSSNYEQS